MVTLELVPKTIHKYLKKKKCVSIKNENSCKFYIYVYFFSLFRNILLTGGNCNFPGFKDRVFKDVRSLTPDHFEVNVTLAKK